MKNLTSPSFQFITKLLLVLLDWVMAIPRDVLLQQRRGCHDDSQSTYLGLVMRVRYSKPP